MRRILRSCNSGVVRREVVTALLDLGTAAAAQIKTSLLADLFPDGNAQPVISAAITEMSRLVAAAEERVEVEHVDEHRVARVAEVQAAQRVHRVELVVDVVRNQTVVIRVICS